MRKIIGLLFLLLLEITVDVCCHQIVEIEDQERNKEAVWLNPKFGEDTAKIQVKYIFDLFKVFCKQPTEESHADWIRNHRPFETPSEMINSTNITFTEVIPDDEILPISLLNSVQCDFRQRLTVHFNVTERNALITGSAKFFQSENSSSCQVFFNFTLTRVVKEFAMQNLGKMTKKSAKIVFQDFTKYEMKNFKIMKSESELCMRNASREEIVNLAYQAINNILKERFKIVAELIFKSMLNNCLYPQQDENDKSYSLFNLEPSPDEFPWDSDYYQLNVTGLNHIVYFEAKYLDKDLIHYFSMLLHNVNIHQDIVSVTTKQSNFNSYVFVIAANTDIKTPPDFMKIDLENIVERSRYNCYLMDNTVGTFQLGIPDLISLGVQILSGTCSIRDQCNYDVYKAQLEERRELSKIMLIGIEQTFQNIRYDGTREFTNTLQIILAPFEGKIFENLLNHAEKTSHINSFAWFSNIEMKAYENLENVKCAIDNGNQKIGAITYRNIKAQANFMFKKNTTDGYEIKVQESANVYIKQVNFNISRQRHPNQTNEIAIKIDDDFKTADITISLDDKRLRKNCITLGKAISEDFIKLFQDRFKNTVNSTFYPFFNTCTCNTSSSSCANPNSNYFADSRQYYAFIRGHWILSAHLFSIQSIDVLINGTWNFKDINMRYLNGNLILDGLRMEKVTGKMKLWKNSNEWTILDYSASYLSLIIDHENTSVKVNVPGGLKLSNPSMFKPEADEILEIFETAVALFIARSIYDDSMKYHAKYQMLASKTTNEAVQKYVPLMYDKTLVFVNNIVKILKNISSNAMFNQPEEIPLQPERENASFNLPNLQSRFFVNFEVPVEVREICDDFDYSHNVSSFVEWRILSGNIMIREGSGSGNQLSRVDFQAVDRCVLKISNNKNECSKQLNININTATMTINKYLQRQEEDILKEKFIQTATKLVRELHNERFLSSPHICHQRLGYLEPSENDFFLITNTINTKTQRLLTFHIKLYGLYNLKYFRHTPDDDSNTIALFAIQSGNLTAHIIRNYNIENSPPKIPREMKLQIDGIRLQGIINNRFKTLLFTDHSRLLFSNQNVQISPRFQQRLNEEIVGSIEKLVTEEYFRDQPTHGEVGDYIDHSSN